MYATLILITQQTHLTHIHSFTQASIYVHYYFIKLFEYYKMMMFNIRLLIAIPPLRHRSHALNVYYFHTFFNMIYLVPAKHDAQGNALMKSQLFDDYDVILYFCLFLPTVT